MKKLYKLIKMKLGKLINNKTFSLKEKHIGFIYKTPAATNFILEYGSPETLSGTDNNKWIVYFPKGDFTVGLNKKTMIFEKICVSRHPNLKYKPSK